MFIFSSFISCVQETLDGGSGSLATLLTETDITWESLEQTQGLNELMLRETQVYTCTLYIHIRTCMSGIHRYCIYICLVEVCLV